ncbi:hypothetical protein ABIB40_001675 [Pedobacter sp. UYP30]|uniref:oxygenase MpaB family protein n=1 Tax=Pedobacter sp. UYP30 TaxID=1756400 RepID=UPI003398D921
MSGFVEKNHIIRKVWGNGDTILFIFAGASAEFALNKAVDWLYFTGKLPKDPLGRLFSTVAYARKIIFSENSVAIKAIHQITEIHKGVEKARAAEIPDWAYRDVLYMLIDYSIRAFEIIEYGLSEKEKVAIFEVFKRVGLEMGIKDLPIDYVNWLVDREKHSKKDLIKSKYSKHLYKQYRIRLGLIRFLFLKQAQLMILPKEVIWLLGFKKILWLSPIIKVYKWSKKMKINNVIRNSILPAQYKQQILDLDRF